MTSELSGLRQRRRELRQSIAEMQAAYGVAKEQIGTEIAGIKAAADAAAAQMRSAFGAAVAAYAAKNGAMAAGLAAEGRAAQAQAQAMNAQASQLSAQLSERRERIQKARAELRQLEQQIHDAEAVAEAARARRLVFSNPAVRQVEVKGFHLARGIDEQMVRQVLSELAPKLVAEIASVTYVNEFGRGSALGRTSAKPNIPVKGQIYLYDSFEYELETRQADYRATLVHEAGHVLFERLTSGAQRFEWGNMFNRTLHESGAFISDYAPTSLREDFAESFMYYRMHPGELYNKFRTRYDFIDRLYKEVSE